MRLLLFLSIFLAPHAFSEASLSGEEISQILQMEWKQLRETVGSLKPDGKVGGFYDEKVYDGYSLMWKISDQAEDNEVIRFYAERPDSDKAFAVTYYKSYAIAPGRLVIRRFVGAEPHGWKNHTVDLNTGEYLGTQGAWKPDITESEKLILKEWGIQPF